MMADDTPGPEQEPGYRRYAEYEPAENQLGGVYYQARNFIAEKPRIHVPPFLSREFFRFLVSFLKSPDNNPVFMREWRRNTRNLGLAKTGWLATFVMIGAVAALATTAGLNTLHGLDLHPLTRKGFANAAFFLPGLAGALVGFFLGMRATGGSAAAIEELSLTLLHPQEIAFGHLFGGVLPFSFPALILLPSFCVIGVDVFLVWAAATSFGSIHALSFAFWIYPWVASSMLAGASISQALTFRRDALFYPLAVWALIQLLLAGYIIFTFATAWPFTFLVGGPVLFLFQLTVAGGFLHHLAVRYARSQVSEEME